MPVLLKRTLARRQGALSLHATACLVRYAICLSLIRLSVTRVDHRKGPPSQKRNRPITRKIQLGLLCNQNKLIMPICPIDRLAYLFTMK